MTGPAIDSSFMNMAFSRGSASFAPSAEIALMAAKRTKSSGSSNRAMQASFADAIRRFAMYSKAVARTRQRSSESALTTASSAGKAVVLRLCGLK